MNMTDRNVALLERAQQTIPGGVNSPVRAFGAVGGTPRFVQRALGPYFWDSNGTQFIDYIGSWGSMILGHTHPDVVQAMMQAAQQGLSFGAPTEREIQMAELLTRLLPSMQMVRMVSSGTEATMTAIRLARGFTGRSKIIKFEGCYHGHADSLLVKAGSGALTFGNPTSAGVPPEIAAHTMVLDFNDAQQVADAFKAHGDQIACVIVEPVAGNMNLIKPKEGYLQALRDICTQYGAVLIFDEVMTGFRVGLQGVQGHYNVTPDLTTLGKIIGGGMPAAAFGGRADIMKKIAPLGPVYQAGTLSGNPVAVAAGIKTLELIQAPGFYDQLNAQTTQLAKGLAQLGRKYGQVFSTDSIGGMFGFYFAAEVPGTFGDVTNSDRTRFNAFFHACLKQGVYWAPSAYEAGFVSITHTPDIIERTLQLVDAAFADLVKQHPTT